MTTATNSEILRYRYGESSLWVLPGDLGGTRARLFFEKVELHFRESGSPLVIDLRPAWFVDSYGAETLERLRRRHADLAVVGRPRDFGNLPLATQSALNALRPAAGIGEALLSLRGPTRFPGSWGTRRQHPRFPVEIPVEIFHDSLCTAGMLHDLSLGGTRIGRLPGRLLQEIRGNGDSSTLTIAGLDADPLGREIVRFYSAPAIPSRPVYFLPDQTGVGVQFHASRA